MTDIQIARSIKPQSIYEIGKKLGLNEEEIIPYGKIKGKIEPLTTKGAAKIVIVTAISPTPAGEGKSTTTIGLGDALNKIGKKTVICLREPSLGPVFGRKGGACGGGRHQVIPMEDINLHFNGDFHAITSANNLICAVIDNHIYQGNELGIDPERITLKRILDINDRSLREITIGQGSKFNGVEHRAGFEITVASELMAILCLCSSEEDFYERISNMEVALTYDGKSVRLKDLEIVGSVMALMKEALKPNLVQTLEHNPVLVHGGPFANIAHGCNSLLATQTATNFGDIVVTEAGFGSDLGFEKFVDIKSRVGDFNVDAAVVVATIRALKYHGGVELADLEQENLQALTEGFKNLERHVENVKQVGIDFVVCLNVFASDTKEEINTFKALCEAKGFKVSISSGYSDGSDGVIDLANQVSHILEQTPQTSGYHYELSDSFEEKVNKVATKVYGAKKAKISDLAQSKINQANHDEIKDFMICIAKTPVSFSDNQNLLNAPEDFEITITDIKINYGAGFIVCYANKIITMPGLPKEPNAKKIFINENNQIDNIS